MCDMNWGKKNTRETVLTTFINIGLELRNAIFSITGLF